VSYIYKDIISLRIREPRSGKIVQIVNIHNKVGTDILFTLSEMIAKVDAYDKTIILGDFNIYYPV
jgi:endonuclease/exonuclease/phosphatase family metal-dependent hydrolase